MNGMVCATCMYFQVDESRDDKGECRANAPRPTSLNARDNSVLYACWPVVQDDDWCGEWEGAR